MIAMVVLPAFALFLIVGLYRSGLVGHKRDIQSWTTLCERLVPVHSSGIRELANDYLQPSSSKPRRTDDEIWALVGGAEGLTAMKNNSETILEIASRAYPMTPSQGALLSQMQRDSIAMQRALVGLAIGRTSGFGKARVSTYVHEAAASYYLMKQRLLAIYENTHESRYQVLLDTL